MPHLPTFSHNHRLTSSILSRCRCFFSPLDLPFASPFSNGRHPAHCSLAVLSLLTPQKGFRAQPGTPSESVCNILRRFRSAAVFFRDRSIKCGCEALPLCGEDTKSLRASGREALPDLGFPTPWARWRTASMSSTWWSLAPGAAGPGRPGGSFPLPRRTCLVAGCLDSAGASADSCGPARTAARLPA